MAPKNKKCSICGTNVSPKWKTLDRSLLCDDCYDLQCNPPLEPRQEPEPVPGPSGLGYRTETFLSSVSVASNPADDAVFAKPALLPKPSKVVKRTETPPVRNALKKPVRSKPRKVGMKLKFTDETTRPRSVPKLFHDNFWYEVGDIVSLVDVEDNTYYAQIRGLVVDVFNEKSAVLTWLVPTDASPPPNEGFDPVTYHVGPDEDELRDLDQMRFVMHAPNGYFFNRQHPFPRPNVYGPVERDGRSTEVPEYEWTNICHLHYGEHSAR
ncbi:GATA zinc finger domain-containing protein 1-like [Anopheles maculipalpis]|uniref:GATA zinc finger domain-containing protein 1-like n=1 Tax=Anopheles maculipalpis TaxID=1496333 RepID=UPI0021599962|nr:GATA zinc finger domain-containing protein 1-like [Anopheles maculipalpis]